MIWSGAAVLLAFGGLTAAAVWQVLPCLRRLRSPACGPLERLLWPRAEVLLSLKGTDPFLKRCLARLAAQDYPDYRITVVVDSMDDPAWEQAVAAREQFGAHVIEVQVREHQGPRCTRKLSNLLTGFDSLPRDVEVVALCDGDAVVHSTWLKELVSGLEDPAVAAVSGNRWFSPPECGLAQLSRHYWNALAIPATQAYQILWAGSLAIRRKIVDEAEFRGAFSEGFSDDTLIASYLETTGRPYRVLGGTYIINSETTSLRSYWNFLVRQMLCVRLHHPRWRPILLHASALAITLGLLLPAAVVSGFEETIAGLAGLVVYGLTLLVLTSLYEARLRTTFPELETLHVPVTRRRIAMALPALLLTSVIYPAATISAALARRHLWRGVEYHLVNGKVVLAIDHSDARPNGTAHGPRRPRFLGRAAHARGLPECDQAPV